MDADGEAVEDGGRIVAHAVRDPEDFVPRRLRQLAEAAGEMPQLGTKVIVPGAAELAAAAADQRLNTHAVPGRHVRDALTDCGHAAAELVPTQRAANVLLLRLP